MIPHRSMAHDPGFETEEQNEPWTAINPITHQPSQKSTKKPHQPLEKPFFLCLHTLHTKSCRYITLYTFYFTSSCSSSRFQARRTAKKEEIYLLILVFNFVLFVYLFRSFRKGKEELASSWLGRRFLVLSIIAGLDFRYSFLFEREWEGEDTIDEQSGLFDSLLGCHHIRFFATDHHGLQIFSG